MRRNEGFCSWFYAPLRETVSRRLKILWFSGVLAFFFMKENLTLVFLGSLFSNSFVISVFLFRIVQMEKIPSGVCFLHPLRKQTKCIWTEIPHLSIESEWVVKTAGPRQWSRWNANCNEVHSVTPTDPGAFKGNYRLSPARSGCAWLWCWPQRCWDSPARTPWRRRPRAPECRRVTASGCACCSAGCWAPTPCCSPRSPPCISVSWKVANV